MTPLHEASLSGAVETMRILLDLAEKGEGDGQREKGRGEGGGGGREESSGGGVRSLHLAAKGGSLGGVRLLLERRAKGAITGLMCV